MIRILAFVRRTAVIEIGVLLSMSLSPISVALACEGGGGEELKTDVTVTPKPVHFGAANKTEKIKINAVEQGKYKILEQNIAEDINNRFSFVGGTSPCLNTRIAKPAEMGAPEKCELEIKATGLVDGEDANFVTKFEREPAVYATTFYDPLKW